ncbi:MAG: hypothetical protein FVQ76_11535 [Nitrospira sp.]|nr:hypothetical protein [Nitrospira sp.]
MLSGNAVKGGLTSLVLVGMALMILGCSKIQEPWVTSDQPLTDERTRSVEQQRGLRHRIMTSQIER